MTAPPDDAAEPEEEPLCKDAVCRLAARAAHDLNNLLSVILGQTELAALGLAPGHPAHHQLSQVRDATLRCTRVTNDLAALARSPRVLDINATVDSLLPGLRSLVGDDVALAWLPGTRVRPVRLDPAQLAQVMMGLCSHAKKASLSGGQLTLETRNASLARTLSAVPDAVPPGEYAVLSIRDTGRGIRAEELPGLFEPAFTLEAPADHAGPGLPTVYAVLKQNDAFLQVSSAPGAGNTVSIYFRASPAAVEFPPGAAEHRVARGHGTLLLVDDEPAILAASKLVLEQLGYTVLAAGTPELAMALAAQHAGDIHLLVTDFRLPGMNGGELAAQLRTSRPELRCVIMSGLPSGVVGQAGGDAGGRVLEKPFTRETLAAAVREALAARR
ncbi:MAG: response regulator [Deltaproteobacteria bacterium]|nr:response regulator [Deltaproteobacteria bacterium]